jgi:hypothetical protein
MVFVIVWCRATLRLTDTNPRGIIVRTLYFTVENGQLSKTNDVLLDRITFQHFRFLLTSRWLVIILEMTVWVYFLKATEYAQIPPEDATGVAGTFLHPPNQVEPSSLKIPTRSNIDNAGIVGTTE